MDSPLSMARAIAARRALDAREAALRQVMPDFHPLVSATLAYMLADQIIQIETVDARRTALDQVPASIRDRVRTLVLMWFSARAELRARASIPAGVA